MLHIHRAERADGLVGGLGGVLATPLADPMTPEIVAVPTRGVERWVTQCLSAVLGVTGGAGAAGRVDGVCANIDFPFPGRLVGGAVAIASGVDPDEDPWLPERSVWPLLRLVDRCLAEPWLTLLAGHLGGVPGAADADPEKRRRRFGTVRHLAGLYDRYAVHRPEMLRAWVTGSDTDGAGRKLPEEGRWQAELWRRLRADISAPSPAERLLDACTRLVAEPGLVDLPERLSLFGLTRLPASHVDILRALAEHRDVHLFLLHPSPALWARVERVLAEEPPVLAGIVSTARPRRSDPTAHLSGHPLLGSWGGDSREIQLVLAAAGGVLADPPPPGDASPTVGAPAGGARPAGSARAGRGLGDGPATLLARIQADIRADRAPAGEPLKGTDRAEPDERPLLDPADRSLQVHACHGRARQVEVIRDAVLHLLAADPTLEARDVIVMCPDIEVFAPLVHATFGAGEVVGDNEDEAALTGPTPAGGRPKPPDLRVRLADRSLRQTNPVLGVTAELLDLASARVTAPQVLDLAAREPVRRRFRFDDDDLARLTDWVTDTGIRWGLDAPHRAPYKLDTLEVNTWRAGLDRVLLGVAMAEGGGYQLFGEALPFDDVDSGSIDLAGRFAEFVDRLAAALGDLAGPKTVADWAAALAVHVGALTDTTSANAWQGAQVRRMLDDIISEAGLEGKPAGESESGGATAVLALPEIRDLLADRLEGRPTRANFRTGHMTVCTLHPMRSVPHRVVCLLGLDDGMFPRRSALDGDDLILAEPHVGDRDVRAEDRQLLLDALLAATDHLIVTYTGRDERTNTLRPPAVPVGELLDVVDRTVRTTNGEAAKTKVVVDHPLQPFDPRNFTSSELVPAVAWSFDPVALDGARALVTGRHEIPDFLPGPLPTDPVDPVEIDQLVRFVQHPAKAFLRQRLGISLFQDTDDVADSLPVQLDALEQWDVGTRLLEARLAGVPAEVCEAAEKARGGLPPGQLADTLLKNLRKNVDPLVAAVEAVTAGVGEPGPFEVDVTLPDGRTLIGTVPGVGSVNGGLGLMLRTVNYSRVGPKHRLAAWVRYLAVAAARPDLEVEAVTVGRRQDWGTPQTFVTIARIGVLADSPAERRRIALSHLATLVDLYDRGLREPLPLVCKASQAWAVAARRTGGRLSPADAAAKEWESSYERRNQEDSDPEHLLVCGGQQPMAKLLEAPPTADEEGDGWVKEEETRFGRYARRLWDALLDVEKLEDQ